MSANVESMMYVREKPWHGLGTMVAEAPTSKEALELAGLNWTVENLPIYDGKGNEIPGYKANTRNTDGRVMGVVSTKYQIVQNAEAFEFTDALIGENVRYETAGSLWGGKKIWLLARMPDRLIAGDKFEPFICFTNTHDGTGAVRAIMTPVRVVCNNTLNLALSGAKRAWSTPHRGNVQARLEEARQTLELAETYLDELAVEADKMANEPFTEADLAKALGELFPLEKDASDRQKRLVDDARKQIITCYFRQDLVQFLGTKWGFINAVSDYVGHGEPGRKTKTFEENRWGNIMSGRTILDRAAALV